ncbi:MAG TPA: hypothetical protein VNS32_17125 [Flavisolibacter sp.]|nr:hypothetical protein [Flavisolibacter sp.]
MHAWDENKDKLVDLRSQLSSNPQFEKADLGQKLNEQNSFSVSINFSRIFIPAFPCNQLEIKRVYNVENDKEEVYILIDGMENELTKQVGPEIFINDFILRKEIAKFFFFDAEKIVSLAEVHSLEERKNLSQAYTEVLGIKKYLDLKEHLENVRVRFRKRTIDDHEEKWNRLLEERESKTAMLDHNTIMIREKESELLIKQNASDKMQERLIREGSAISVEELKEFRRVRDEWMIQGNELKSEFKDLVDLAPLAIAGHLINKIKEQFESEQEQSEFKKEAIFFKRKLDAIDKELTENQRQLHLDKATKQQIIAIIQRKLLPKEIIFDKSLLNFSLEEENEFLATYDLLTKSYNKSVKKIFKDLKVQQSSYASLNRRIADAESKAEDPVIKKIRADKCELDNGIEKLRNQLIELKAANLALNNDLGKINAQISALNSKRKVDEIDKAKDELAGRLINNLSSFITRLKNKKKRSLEENIQKELSVLMHKSSFVNKVEVKIQGELIEIELYDEQNRVIDKDNLSKGEQQLYASALLKALVNESHIRFPVFIDSPLQKFDKEHARNIIVGFYPNISKQVVLFPLLEKEFTKTEYELIHPRISNCYLIKQSGQYQSQFAEISPSELFTETQLQHV